jgi:acetyltransferase-like isoleucine patch superfamily enzyme
MTLRKIVACILPTQIKQYVRTRINGFANQIKAPKMIWGYKDSTGQFRYRTRISDTVFWYHPERIKIADNVFIGHYTILDGTGGLEIDEGAQIGAWVGIFTHSSHVAIRLYGNHYQEVPEREKKGYPIKKVKIGKYVFIGAGAKIFPGVSVGEGALIAAGSIVNRDVAEFEIVSGNPAQVVGDTRALDKPYLSDPQIEQWYNEWQVK